MILTARNDPMRWSPAIHVNQTGYIPGSSKKAIVGYYLGSLGELDLQPMSPEDGKAGPASAVKPLTFKLLDQQSHKEVFTGSLSPRSDQGFPFDCYQRVFEADFSTFKAVGQFQLFVPGLGVSVPFFI